MVTYSQIASALRYEMRNGYYGSEPFSVANPKLTSDGLFIGIKCRKLPEIVLGFYKYNNGTYLTDGGFLYHIFQGVYSTSRLADMFNELEPNSRMQPSYGHSLQCSIRNIDDVLGSVIRFYQMVNKLVNIILEEENKSE